MSIFNHWVNGFVMNDKRKRIIRKYYEFIITKVKLIFLQKKFIYEGTELKYIFKREKSSQSLVVVFSSCTRRGLKARYNYMKTLSSCKVNQLFILDDFAEDHRGSYYMGKDFTFCEEKATLALIDMVKTSIEAKRIICCGSSKGGYASLNIGLQIEGSYIIAGGPQFFLDTYLRASSNLECRQHILGTDSENKSRFLDDYLKNRIRTNPYIGSQHIFLHYSNKEHTYEEHIKYLLDELRTKEYEVICDVADYEKHSDISYYFPDFLKREVCELSI